MKDAKVALWKSRPNSKTALSGKINWTDDQGNVDFNSEQNSTAFLYRDDNAFNGNVVDKDMQKQYRVELEYTNSNRENAPTFTGQLYDLETGEYAYKLVLWKNDIEEGSRRPIISGHAETFEPESPQPQSSQPAPSEEGKESEEVPF
jgi:hypothetical protein